MLVAVFNFHSGASAQPTVFCRGFEHVQELPGIHNAYLDTTSLIANLQPETLPHKSSFTMLVTLVSALTGTCPRASQVSTEDLLRVRQLLVWIYVN